MNSQRLILKSSHLNRFLVLLHCNKHRKWRLMYAARFLQCRQRNQTWTALPVINGRSKNSSKSAESMLARNRSTWAASGSDGSEKVHFDCDAPKASPITIFLFIYLFLSAATFEILSMVIPRTTWGLNSTHLSYILSEVSSYRPSRVIVEI